MKTSDFDYSLPPEFIAQTPIEPRDSSRLMVVNRAGGAIAHRRFMDIVDYLSPGDVLVFNESRVIPARLVGETSSGAKVEILLLRRIEAGCWEVLGKPGKRLRLGAKFRLADVQAEVVGAREEGVRTVHFSDESRLPALGAAPLPPYIRVPLADPERYQTVYSRVLGSAAAPTAGLHFTPELLARIKSQSVRCVFVTLHIGLDTFRPVKEDDPRRHHIHCEFGSLDEGAARILNEARRKGKRVVYVGTTSARLVEHAACLGDGLGIQPFQGQVDLFILPGYRFKVADAMITNFHLPRSTLLMMVSAFAGPDLVRKAYQEAIASGYRFYSFGDAMLVL